ncbi:hypothetical protein HUT18_24555 [Streptomyces sp. NA04227]|nr:hypothetical protein HUT18_24555 [Streptomyces sp. NA04227]
MKVTVPKDATETKGAIQVNPREDTYFLSFVTSEANAEKIAEDLHFEDPLKADQRGFNAQGRPFGHLGLPEPQTVKGARYAGVSPADVNDHRRKIRWIEIYVQTLKAERARVYLTAW